jgi:meiotic recombination protein DMC1
MRKDLLKIKGFSEIKVEKVKDAASKMAVGISPYSHKTIILLTAAAQPYANSFMTAAELGHVRKRCIRLSTGSKQLDNILNG